MEINFWSPLGLIPTKIKRHTLIYVAVTQHAALPDCTNAPLLHNTYYDSYKTNVQNVRSFVWVEGGDEVFVFFESDKTKRYITFLLNTCTKPAESHLINFGER
jgi:hypothetical protein